MDVGSLVPAVIAGATVYGPTAAEALGKIVGTEVVKEVTKDAYRSLKTALESALGNKARRAISKVEEDPNSSDARADLKAALESIDAEDEFDIDAKAKTLLQAIRDDAGAARAVDVVASIKLDIDSGGNVFIANVKGVESFDVKSKSVGDFSFSDVDMHKDSQKGN